MVTFDNEDLIQAFNMKDNFMTEKWFCHLVTFIYATVYVVGLNFSVVQKKEFIST